MEQVTSGDIPIGHMSETEMVNALNIVIKDFGSL